jgi:aspartate/tyrosine/aromatic aminotransferase
LLSNQFNVTSDDIFSHITQAPVDPIFGISMAYKADKFDKKIDLGVGAYRTDEEKPYVFNIVK